MSGAMVSQPRVAIVHYWLVTMRGGERVLERLLQLYPHADVFTHVYDPGAVSEAIRSRVVNTSWINRLPGARSHYQKYLPFMPRALEDLDLSRYDLVISSEAGPAKGVIARPDALHICYAHSPMRYLWDHYHEYRRAAGSVSRAVMPHVFHRLRTWDTISAARLDGVIANSRFIRQRVRRAWGRDAEVVYPPVSVDEFRPSTDVGSHYLWVSQMVPYKRANVALEAFNRLGLPLLMVGDGAFAREAERKAGPNVTVKRRLSFPELKQAYATARALVFTPEEDFGIVPVEANASGRPVLAFGRGGARETIVAEETGLFFDEQSVESLIDGVERLEKWLPYFDPAAAVTNARRFAPEVFDRGFMAAVADFDAAKRI